MNTHPSRSQIGSASELNPVSYQSGFGNEFETEAVAGALPVGQNSPQRTPFNLHSELISGTTFVAPRALNRRSYTFRLRPSTIPGEFQEIDAREFRTPPLPLPLSPDAFRWAAFPLPEQATDFLDGTATICGNGSPLHQQGMAMHVYRATRSMDDRVFANLDGEMLILPELGGLQLFSEFGILQVEPGEVAIVPKGVKFRVDLLGAAARGFVCENFGAPFRLPELGLIGSNGLANVVDFLAPVAAFEERDTPTQLVQKYGGRLWAVDLGSSPLDVVAWRGTLTPFKYDLKRFVAMSSVTVDHPDPSINTVLTSPSDPVMGSNVDFMVVGHRWNVSNTFPRAGFHRNCVPEFSGVLMGGDGPLKSGESHLNNSWVPHGPEPQVLQSGRDEALKPAWQDSQVFFLIETRYPLQLSDFAMSAPGRMPNLSARFAGYDQRRDTLRG